jgi:DUF2934 family protein
MSKHHHRQATSARSDSTGPATAAQIGLFASEKDHNAPLVVAEDIRVCAYQKWEIAGKPHGDSIQFWLEAERELRTRSRQ